MSLRRFTGPIAGVNASSASERPALMRSVSAPVDLAASPQPPQLTDIEWKQFRQHLIDFRRFASEHAASSQAASTSPNAIAADADGNLRKQDLAADSPARSSAFAVRVIN